MGKWSANYKKNGLNYNRKFEKESGYSGTLKAGCRFVKNIPNQCGGDILE